MQFSPGTLLAHKSTRWLIAIVAVALFAIANLPWQLEDYDQAKQAFTSFEMVQQGHWWFQHTPNEWIATKPPLVGWMSAASFALTRSWNVAWRLPSFLCGLALFATIAVLTRNAFGLAASLVASSAFAFNLFAPRLATLVRTDMPLTLLTFLIGAQIWLKLRSGEWWTTRERVIAFLLLLAAMLVKGPIVYAFLLPGIIAFNFITRRRDNPSAWCGWWPWIISVLAFFIWVGIGVWNVPEFLDDVVLREFAGRFEGTHRAQPFYFYWLHLLANFAPWSLLLILFAIFLRRTNAGSSSSRIPAPMLWLICWSVGGLIVMSFVPSKRVDRIFPVVPPLCLLVASQFAALQSRSRGRAELLGLISIVAAMLVTTGGVVTKILRSMREERAARAQFGELARKEAAANGWRLAVINGTDECMLLYLRQTEFVEPLEAAGEWNAGAVNAIIGPAEKLDPVRPRLQGGTRSVVGPPSNTKNTSKYVLLLRE